MCSDTTVRTLATANLAEFCRVQVSKNQCVRRVCNDVSIVALNSHFIDFVAIERLENNSHAGRHVLHNHLKITHAT